ncbi:CPXCG motif-containing cysteine-rich protein [Salegentibacter salarius]|uniref:CPXCG motif-containing cysteine-rich protein n=1 Tax=Salegentibacter salarius TaxID=435906 RepID=UPI0009A80685|nr:CPXCG motif-containing cysteine-rich protein [Salegentibacter salarius]
MFEHFFLCPYCWEEISVLLDPSVSRQTYIEDCENCCNPIEFTVSFSENELQSFEANSIEQ